MVGDEGVKYTVVIPVLDEAENLELLLPKLLVDPDCEVLVCDNGSTDGSVGLAARLGARVNVGTGTVTSAILRGFKYASYDSIVVMDGDLSHPPELASEIASKLSSYDIVVGARAKSSDTLRNRVISSGFNLLTWLLAPKLKDRASGLWGIKKTLTSTKIRDTVKPMLEFLVRTKTSRVGEVGYVFYPRMSGSSKLGKPILSTLWTVVMLYFFKFQRPIRFLIVGAIGTGVNLGLLWFFTEKVHVWYIWSEVAAILLATAWSYLANNYWTFKQKDIV